MHGIHSLKIVIILYILISIFFVIIGIYYYCFMCSIFSVIFDQKFYANSNDDNSAINDEKLEIHS